MSISKTKDNFTGTLLKFSLESQPGCFDALNLSGAREKITINCKGKTRTRNTKHGQVIGRTSDYKKAVVFLKADSKPIAFFESLN